jgi:hypothetical protein
VVAVWFELMLQEAGGDLDLAVRTYHRGWSLASRGKGEAYLANVICLRRRYIRNENASPAWQFLFARAFGVTGERRHSHRQTSCTPEHAERVSLDRQPV